MALSIGLFGSLHCIGMCGPIAVMVPGRERGFWGPTLLYHTGKILSYGLVGIVIGLIGQGIAFSGLQSWFSIALGAFMIITAVLSIPIESKALRIPGLNQFYGVIRNKLGQYLKKEGATAGFTIGFLNGFIPCGLVYLAVAGAIAVGSWWKGAAFMALFGLGTMPALVATAFFSKRLTSPWRNRLGKLLPYFLILLGVIFIYRGIQAEFPVDLRFWELKDKPMMCH